tara:strand:+ start:9296 stop:10819 length:1524 start_codon:yes stop_codon:yes gene_type:complete
MNQETKSTRLQLVAALFCFFALANHACVESADVLSYLDGDTKLLAAESTTLLGTPGSQIGESIRTVGDIDGDGLDDMVFVDREYRRASDDHQRGAIHIIYGGTVSGATMPVNGHVIELLHAFKPRPLKVGKVGDMNGDGFADFIVGDPYGTNCYSQAPTENEKQFGRAYLVYGRAQRFDSLSQIADVATTIRDSTPCTKVGWGVSGLGDIDGDGFADLALGNDLSANEIALGHGRLHIFYGSTQKLSGTVALQSSDAVLAAGSQSASFALSVATAGDVNGDGFADFLIAQGGAPNGEEGAVFLVNGSAKRMAGEVSLAAASSRFVGAVGISSTGVDDLDGDGFGDFAIDGRSVFHVYYGRPEGFAVTQTLAEADALLQPRDSEMFATSGIGAGDLDGDGHVDLIVGDGSLEGTRGGAYVLYGSSYRLSGDIPLDEFGTTYVGQLQSWSENDGVSETGDWAGFSICVGDIDGDGFADFGVGAPNYTVGGPAPGRVYLIRGQERVDVQL